MTDTTTATAEITPETTQLVGFVEERRAHFGDVGYQGSIPLAEARKLIGWEPEEYRVVGQQLDDDGTLINAVIDPSRKMLVHPHTGRPLAVHGSGYKVHPYEETLLTNAERITDGELGLARVGLLRDGRRAYVQYEMSDNVHAAEGVVFRPFLNAATSLDGSLATSYFTGSTVIVCDNTLAIAMKESTVAGRILRVRHTRNSQLDVSLARETLGIVFQVADEFAAEVRKLTDEYVSDWEWKLFLDAVAPLPEGDGRGATLALNKRAELGRLWETDLRVAPWKNSAWGVVSAMNTYSHHFATVKNSTRGERNMARSINGDLAKLDRNTLRILAEVRS